MPGGRKPVPIPPLIAASIVVDYRNGATVRSLRSKYRISLNRIRRVFADANIELRWSANRDRAEGKVYTDGLSATARHMRRLKEKNICGTCKGPSDGCWSCPKCRKEKRDKVAELRRRGICTSDSCGKPVAPGRKLCDKCLKYHRNEHYKLRDQAFAAYGGAVCVCCGETEKVFLCLDHINNDGAQDRRRGRATLYRRLRAAKWPPGFQILCHNCNYAKHVTKGNCPHKRFRQYIPTMWECSWEL